MGVERKRDASMLSKENGFTLPWRFPVSVDRGTVFAIAILLATLLLVYSNSLQGEWHFDDFHTIVNNPNNRLQTLTWDELRKSFYGPTYGTEDQHITRPMAYASFALNHFFGGSDVRSYHIVNVLIHVASSLFLFLLIRLTLTLPVMREHYDNIAYPVALLSAFLWATSPLHVHAVTIIVQRMASMAGLFYVASLYFYARGRIAVPGKTRISAFLVCGMCAAAAFATKENTAVLPLALLLYDFFFIQGISAESARKTLKWAILPLSVMLVLGFLYTDFTLLRATYDVGVRPFTLWERLLTQGRVLFFYVSLLLYPIPSRLTLLHDIDISRSLIDPWTTLAAIAGIILSLSLAILKARQYPLISFAVLFFFLNHLIEGTIIPLELIFEHRNYIPSMFFFVPIATVMVNVLHYFSYSRKFQIFMAGGFALLLAFQGHTTFERNEVVSSDLHLWLDNVQKSPNISRPRINLAKHYYEAGMYEQAVREFETAEGLNRDTNLRQVGIASYGLGLYYLKEAKDIGRAEEQFIKALDRFPGFASAVVGLATIHLQRGDVEKAWALIKVHAPRQPNNTEIMNCYGLVLLKKGNARDALKSAASAMRLRWTDPRPWEISGEAWRQLGCWKKAAQCWEEALRLNPANARALLALVEIYERVKDRPALARVTARCLVRKETETLRAWLDDLAALNAAAVYEVDPHKLARIIRDDVKRQVLER